MNELKFPIKINKQINKLVFKIFKTCIRILQVNPIFISSASCFYMSISDKRSGCVTSPGVSFVKGHLNCFYSDTEGRSPIQNMRDLIIKRAQFHALCGAVTVWTGHFHYSLLFLCTHVYSQLCGPWAVTFLWKSYLFLLYNVRCGWSGM